MTGSRRATSGGNDEDDEDADMALAGERWSERRGEWWCAARWK
jgi:hypothetical protein